MFTFDLLINAVAAGLMLGGFYAAVAIGLSITFGQLDIVNIAHPTFVILGSFVAFVINESFGIDPVLIGVVFMPIFYFLGMGLYQIYYVSFEKTGQESLSGLAFFFGLMFILEVLMILAFGVDYRLVSAAYIGETLHIGPLDLPLRMLIPAVAATLMTIAVVLYMSKTFMGKAIMAVSQDRLALQLMGADPIRVKRIALGIAIATAALAGALLIIIQPVEPSVGRLYIGRIFAIVVLGGMGSISGTFFAAILIGVVESFIATFYGPSWAPAVGFGILLLTLAIRPQGLFGRA
ncbi:MAG: branched-chain amino acid ABC transporter permease [Rhodospirillaceae bacterium]|nr:branched-chain amino acid ABC transporter permease [Rhodospirillaceae bacterium]MBT3887295.1 branched-chain amino acid ABC transporter permease [Rhodospirillaceae bacterium]MBT4118522.1 branched-chain amino acid ABC transporter permease [Rhodospirillaceae bacterium]MBT4671984.1 branched-chain amino acid ABC transporter permease [Rhodospirillaceae bacterium]MBT4720678.1 branched-chain amino acid ABC transporter permease [Rhodospirillaceae bacterium]